MENIAESLLPLAVDIDSVQEDPRKHPEKWGRRGRIEPAGKDNEDIEPDINPRDKLLSRLQDIARNESMVDADVKAEEHRKH